MADPQAEEPTIDEMVAQYVRMRDALQVADQAHKDKTAKARKWLETQNNKLLARLNTLGVDNAKTPSGTVYRKTSKSATIADADSFRRFIIGGEAWDLVDWRANGPAIAAFLDENKEPPPGINYTVTHDVGVRRS